MSMHTATMKGKWQKRTGELLKPFTPAVLGGTESTGKIRKQEKNGWWNN